jgi:hypothetical protein
MFGIMHHEYGFIDENGYLLLFDTYELGMEYLRNCDIPDDDRDFTVERIG